MKWFKSFFEFEGNTSSKRAISLICAIALVTYAFVYPSDSANNSVLVLAITRKIYKRPDGLYRLTYFDDTDSLVVCNITD